jgi:hypothetical protein
VWTNDEGETETFPSVTTILSRVLAKPAIPRWAARSCGEYVRDNMRRLYSISRDDPELVVELVKAAPWKIRDAAADRGTLVHALAEAIALDQTPTVPPELEGYVRAYENWVADFQVEYVAAEASVYSREIGYAGTLDAIVRVPSLGQILVDFKTGKDVYPEAALQLTAYRWADFIGMPDGSEVYMPDIDGSYVLHLMDGKYHFVSVKDDRARWLSVVDLFHWSNEKGVVGATVSPGAML